MAEPDKKHLLLIDRGWHFDKEKQRWFFPRNGASLPQYQVKEDSVDHVHKLTILMERGFQNTGKTWKKGDWVIANSRVTLLKPDDLLKAVRLIQKSATEGRE